MQKHKYNIFPDASKEDFDLLVCDISKNGYDLDFPIILYQGAILDGWNRWRACQQVGEKPATKEFTGSDTDAINYTLRTNKRRNLTSSQWATIAVDAEEIMAAIAADVERERLRKQKEHAANQHSVPSGNKLPEGTSLPTQETSVKAAAIFNTNKQYIKDAKRLKATRPEAFKAVQSGEKTITQVKKEIKTEKKEQERTETAVMLQSVNIEEPATHPKRTPKTGEWWQLGKHLLYCGDTSSEAFTKHLPTCALAFADPPYNADAAEWDNDFNWQHDYLAGYAGIVAVTPGIVSIFDFAKTTTMPYVWSLSCTISNGMTRGAVGFGNWIYAALFSHGSVYRNSQDVMTVSIKTSESGETTHKGRKPSEFLALLFNKFTKAGDTIIDPFLGSGQTLLVCEKIDRVCIGGEISPEFCAEIINRWENVTGDAAHVNSI